MSTILPMTIPTCGCCATAQTLLPRPELAAGLLVCPATGACYQIEGGNLRRVAMPTLAVQPATVPTVQIDLNRSSYA